MGWSGKISPLEPQPVGCGLFMLVGTDLRARGNEVEGPMDWRHRAACRDEDPELFFPIGNTGPALAQIEEAKKVCARCEVKDPCLQWALESGQEAGVWGGMSEDERRALKRRVARNRARMAELNRMTEGAREGV